MAGGMLPYAIEWQTDTHPSVNMEDLDCSFHSLEIYHPYSRWLQSAIESIGALDLVNIHALPKNKVPYMIANINTPGGIKKLHSCATFNEALQRTNR